MAGRSERGVKRALITVVLAGLTLLGLATPALAHDSLVGSTPADKSTVDASPPAIELRFDEPVQQGAELNTVVVTDAQRNHWEAGPAVVKGNAVAVPLRPLGAPGVYTVDYRIVSADGHPGDGSITFTLSKTGNGAPATATNAQQPAVATPGEPGGKGLPVWAWILGAAVLLGIGLTLALRIGKKR
ncbi:copper resistance protein CopC [Amycolatopsis sp. NPDC059021]|uniref:copper resistance CopC family protein n=1 Tax=Amycolatopsis sp. NPDC059021 TaxID=3346704 RepID=UPI0036735B15